MNKISFEICLRKRVTNQIKEKKKKVLPTLFFFQSSHKDFFFPCYDIIQLFNYYY